MSRYIFSFWLLILFLFPHGSFSKSSTKQESNYDSGNLNTKSEVDQVGVDDSPALHDGFRPRHKFKTDSASQSRFYRSEMDSEKEQEVKIPQCAVMYKNSEPVGILQPFEDSYRFLQVNGDPTLVDINPIPVKRKTIMDVLYPSKIVDDYDTEVVDNTAQFTDERYPSIFAKFKIDSRLDKSLNPDIHLKRSMHKRGSEKNNINEERMGSIKPTFSKSKIDDGVAVEDELKNILDDMGLINDYSDNKEDAKREAEDENLEMGTNKISLVKEERKEKRNKREDQSLVSISSAVTTLPLLSKKSLSLNAAVSEKETEKETVKEEKHVEEERSVDLLHPNENSKVQEESEIIDLEVSTEKEAEEDEARKKRQNEIDNKDNKRNIDVSSSFEFTTSSLVKEDELSEYERRVEREIRDKIEKLKNEVKKEISELKQSDIKNKKEGFAEDTKRRKRQIVNTLLDEETADINPLANTDEKSQNHIRRKRNTILDEQFTLDESLENKDTSKSTESNKEGQKMLAIHDNEEHFIGINPILESHNTTNNYEIRTEEGKNLINIEENKSHIRTKRETSDESNEKMTELANEDKLNVRRKREAREDIEEDSYQDDDSQFNEDVSYENLKSNNQLNIDQKAEINLAQLDRMANSQFTSSADGCKCDKNSNDCKCGKTNVDLNLPNFKEEDSNDLSTNEVNIEKKSVNQHCACGKNDNHCKCGHILDDISSPYKRDYYSENELNAANENSINEKNPLNELQFDATAAFPKRLRERKRNVPNPVEKSYEAPNRLKEEETDDDYDTGEISSFGKRDIKPRKFSANRPFKNGEYFVDLHPDIYRISPSDKSREKRDNFELVAVHGGSPITKHLVAIRERSIMPHSRFRRRVLSDDDKQPRQLIDMSDEDLFGALSQSYAGELARYKRVKRTKTKK